MKIEDIKTICAIGSGVMGLGTALSFAMAGYDVRLYIQQRIKENGIPENIEEKIASRMANLRGMLESFVDNGLIPAADVPAIMARVTPTDSLKEAATGADFVMESIDEDLEAKRAIFLELREYCRHAILATNTSGISPTEIAEVLPLHMATNFVVAHFFTPPQLVPLVEVVPGALTSENTVATTCALLQKLGKSPVALKQTSPGFIVNAIQFRILEAACELVTSGIATPEMVDQSVREGLNLLGMDIAAAIRNNIGRKKETGWKARVSGLKAFMSQAMRQITFAAPSIEAPLSEQLPAFIVSKIKTVMIDAAQTLCDNGVASPELIDTALKSSIALRLPETGPLESADLGGLDTFRDIFAKTLLMPVPKLIQDALAKKRFGLKKECLLGIYTWTAEKAAAVRARRINALFAHYIAALQQRTATLETQAVRPKFEQEETAPSGGFPEDLALA